MCGPQKKTNHRSDSVLHFLPQKFLSPRQKLVWQVLVRVSVDKLQQVELSVCPFPPLLPHPLPPCPAIRPTRPCPASVGKREAAFSPTEVASPVGLERLRWKVNSWQMSSLGRTDVWRELHSCGQFPKCLVCSF